MADKIREYAAARITIRYDIRRCIHASECVRRLPKVFDVNRRVWIDATQGSPEEIVEAVQHCPTGALHFRREDGGAPEQVAQRNEVRSSTDGPLYLHGDLEIHTSSGVVHDTRAALCRCGASLNKPFCDNSHLRIGFRDRGDVSLAASSASQGASGPLRVLPHENGPFVIEGAFTLVGGDGATTVNCAPRTAFCRCGQSRNKPFCDGSHSQTGFTAP